MYDGIDVDGKMVIDAHALRLLGNRQLAKQQRGLVPAEQSILKMMGSEAQRELASVRRVVRDSRALGVVAA